jgi:glucosamine-6-phosphate deaminase
MRKISRVAPDWWDYTTLDKELLDEAARLTEQDVLALSRPGFQVRFYDTIQEFYLAEALEYIEAWKQATPESPAGLCGPIGPTEQLPLVAQLVNALGLRLNHCHYWGMDEWVVNGRAVSRDFPLGFARTAHELCFDRIRPELRMPADQIHFPDVDTAPFIKSWDQARCVLMQGGQGEVKHWAFNDPPKREGAYVDAPPPPEVYRRLATRLVDLHPMTLMQNARTSGGGTVQNVPHQAMTVGPAETWRAETVSIWHPGHHDNPFGMRLTTLMIAKRLPDAAVPMSLLADHPDVRFSFLRPGFGTCGVEMH